MENPLADIDRMKAIDDPAQRAVEIGKVLNALPDITAELRALRQAAVLELRAQKLSYAQIGEKLGLHRNRVQQIAEGRSAGGQGGGKATAT
jgi:DNA-directed RNA polymerase specialized sigma24 family protein